ncbi:MULTISPECIES: DAK2 domain-containing protein [Chromobacterium]|uniref:DAK2 domain-containing protein n=1 Tax=Chromobacterium TaxID=535 RepID=UPI001886E5A0|nr:MULTISPECIES: DAK2 domain-containing protein [Chromobacterium]WON83574.1 dihydroxyacetone kinase subunit L [Chromobacterium haemolyticum]
MRTMPWRTCWIRGPGWTPPASARDAYQQALASGEGWPQCLRAMQAAAAQGLESTRMMQARLGRAARLGPRSVGVLDAGAASCELLLRTLEEAVLRAVKPSAG